MQASLTKDILGLLGKGLRREQIIDDLLSKGHDEYFVKEIVNETIKVRNAKMRSLGLSLILAGGVLCLLSCIVTMTTSFSSSSFPMVLYGFTTIGIIIIFVGFSKIF